jgi:hypothetical protein
VVDSEDYFGLAPGKIVGLKYAYVIKCDSYDVDPATGLPSVLHCTGTIYIYICTYMLIDLYIYIYVYMYIHAYTFIHIYVYVNMYICICDKV